ncbi:MAG: Hsp70 family protein, partial [Symbiobacteriaceae bacterium]|nr:Hsp70 family protein [Symbiobacteriaceae bacterium]
MSEQTKMVFGIDLGTTYSAIATLDSHGNPYIIANDKDQSMLLASAVFFEPGNPEPIVGIQAKNQAQLDPELVIQRVKREIGKETAPTWVIEGVSYDPTKISALILKRIKQYAEEKLHCPVEDVVITCPAYFGIPERMATRQAGELA